MNLVKKAMSNKNFADSLMESFSVSTCCFAKKNINVFFDKIKSLHLMCCHWKLVEKLILQRNSIYNSFGKFPQQLLVMQIGSWTGTNWDV